MKHRLDYPSARPWILSIGLMIVILLMGFAYHRALQRIRRESLCIRNADHTIASIYYAKTEFNARTIAEK